VADYEEKIERLVEAKARLMNATPATIEQLKAAEEARINASIGAAVAKALSVPKPQPNRRRPRVPAPKEK
jgi:hypothetical protein